MVHKDKMNKFKWTSHRTTMLRFQSNLPVIFVTMTEVQLNQIIKIRLYVRDLGN